MVTDDHAAIKPCGGVALKAASEEELPRFHLVIGYSLESETAAPGDVLKLLEGQNKSLTTVFWKVFKRKSKGNTTVLTLAVEKSSAAVVKKKLQAMVPT